MRKAMTAAAFVAAIALTAGSIGPAFARGGGGGGAGSGGGMASASTGFPAGFSHGNKTGWGTGTSPPGWSHGNKKGWGTGTMPPGLARRQ